MIFMWSGSRLKWFGWLMSALALVTMFGPGRHIQKKAWQSLKRGILNQYNLLEFGAFAGLIGGFIGFFVSNFPIADFFAVSVFITSYHIVSGFVSLSVRAKASRATQKLLDLQPKTAIVVINGKEVVRKISELRIGDLVRVKPGDIIPVDGIVVRGESATDESIVTGESMPIEKKKEDEVVGASINQFGSLDVKVNKVGYETFLRQVVKHLEESRALKPNILIIVDKALKVFVPGVLIFRAMFAALAVLVMDYPCALGMAMPLALIRGGRIAAKKRNTDAFGRSISGIF